MFLILYGCTNQLEIDKIKVDQASQDIFPFAVLGKKRRQKRSGFLFLRRLKS